MVDKQATGEDGLLKHHLQPSKGRLENAPGRRSQNKAKELLAKALIYNMVINL
jgi:hypothetical protein